LRKLVVVLLSLAVSAQIGAPVGLSADVAELLPVEQDLKVLAENAEAAGALGLYRDRATDEMVVVFAEEGSGVDGGLDVPLSLSGRVRLATRPITHSAIEEATTDLLSLGKARGAPDFTFHFDPELGKVVIVSPDQSAFRDVLRKHGDVIVFTEATITLHSREADNSPFSGGAHAKLAGAQEGCSTGFTVVRSNGSRRLVTAGHCFNESDRVFSPGNGNEIGTIAGRSFPDPDLATIVFKQYAATIYVGGAVGAKAWVVGAANPVVGVKEYCRSGRKTHEKCGLEVLGLNGTKCTQGNCTFNLIRYRPTALGGWAQPGDSGAPFYIKNNVGNILIRGLHIAGNEAGTEDLAHRWTHVRDRYNVTIATGP
jgi:hypothetical protein